MSFYLSHRDQPGIDRRVVAALAGRGAQPGQTGLSASGGPVAAARPGPVRRPVWRWLAPTGILVGRDETGRRVTQRARLALPSYVPGEGALQTLSVVVVGLEHHRTPLDLLERVAVAEEDLGKTLGGLRDRANLSEVVVLSTCLRTELYAVVERFHEGVADLQEFLAASAGTTVEVIEEHQSVLFDDAVTVHLFEIAAGLRSSVLGETEVLGQVRRAAETGRGRAGGRAGAVGALPAGGQGGPQGPLPDGHRPGGDLALPRGRGAGPRPAGGIAGRPPGAGGRGGDDGRGHGRRPGPRLAGDSVDRGGQPDRWSGPRNWPAGSGATGSGWPAWLEALETADAVLLSTGSALPVLDPEMMTAVMAGAGGRPGPW